MPHVDMLIDYHVWDAILEQYRRHIQNSKASQHHAELKVNFVANTE